MKKHSRNSDGKEEIQGLKYFKVLAKLTEHLHKAYRDPKHPNKRVLCLPKSPSGTNLKKN